MANPITYADLDRLLVRQGFVPRSVSAAHVAYLDRREEPIFTFPVLPPSEAVRPFHLAAVRRWFLETGLMEEEEFDRWQCSVRFGDGCVGATAVGAGTSRAVGST